MNISPTLQATLTASPDKPPKLLKANTSTPVFAPRSDANDALSKRLQKMNEAVQQLQTMADPREMAKERIAFLKQRLDELKALLRYASPEQAKALASQLRSIASQMASAAKAAAGSGGQSGALSVTSGVTASVTTGVATSKASSAAETSASTATAVAATSTATSSTTAATPTRPNTDEGETQTSDAPAEAGQAEAGKDADQRPLSKDGPSAKGDDNSLRELLEEAKKSLREAINKLKARLRELDAEARQDVAAAEKSLSDIENVTSSLDSNTAMSNLSSSAYAGLGGLAGSGGFSAMNVAVASPLGLAINTAV